MEICSFSEVGIVYMKHHTFAQRWARQQLANCGLWCLDAVLAMTLWVVASGLEGMTARCGRADGGVGTSPNSHSVRPTHARAISNVARLPC